LGKHFRKCFELAVGQHDETLARARRSSRADKLEKAILETGHPKPDMTLMMIPLATNWRCALCDLCDLATSTSEDDRYLRMALDILVDSGIVERSVDERGVVQYRLTAAGKIEAKAMTMLDSAMLFDES
jgi:hypothetical protein